MPKPKQPFKEDSKEATEYAGEGGLLQFFKKIEKPKPLKSKKQHEKRGRPPKRKRGWQPKDADKSVDRFISNHQMKSPPESLVVNGEGVAKGGGAAADSGVGMGGVIRP